MVEKAGDDHSEVVQYMKLCKMAQDAVWSEAKLILRQWSIPKGQKKWKKKTNKNIRHKTWDEKDEEDKEYSYMLCTLDKLAGVISIRSCNYYWIIEVDFKLFPHHLRGWYSDDDEGTLQDGLYQVSSCSSLLMLVWQISH
jgi:hypothetical protein